MKLKIISWNVNGIRAIDKKVDRGIIKFVLLKQLGEAIVTADYDPKLLEKTLLES